MEVKKEEISEIPISNSIYIIICLIVAIVFIIKVSLSKEEIFEEIEKLKNRRPRKVSEEEHHLFCYTQLNTKINRDLLDYSSYYNDKGYTRIYGQSNVLRLKSNQEESSMKNSRRKSSIGNYDKKKTRKVSFVDNDILQEIEYINTHE